MPKHSSTSRTARAARLSWPRSSEPRRRRWRRHWPRRLAAWMPLAAAAVIFLGVFVWENAPAPVGQVDQVDVGPMPQPGGVPQRPGARRSQPPPSRSTAGAARGPAGSAPSDKPGAATAPQDRLSRSQEAPDAPTVRGDSPQASFNKEPRAAAQPAVPPPQAAPSAPEPQSAGAATTARDTAAVQAEERRETSASAVACWRVPPHRPAVVRWCRRTARSNGVSPATW